VCLNKTVCQECISGYLVSDGFGCARCASLLPNCAYCLGYQCLQCEGNYLLDAFGDCRGCGGYVQGCMFCGAVVDASNATALNCTACQSGYLLVLSGSTNLSSCLACNLSLFYCVDCLNLTYCRTCSNISFRNSQFQCSLCSLYLPNCLCCLNETSCIQCVVGFYLGGTNNRSCVSCDPGQFGNATSGVGSACRNCTYVGNVSVCLSCL
jgi:hypothetical protein